MMRLTHGKRAKAATIIAAMIGFGMSGSVAATAPDASLDLSVTGLRSMKGNVLVCVTANPRYFPNCSKDPAGHRAKVAAVAAAGIQFEGLAPGQYAIALIHDENANSKLDMALFLPREGFGFSRNPAVVASPPKFDAAKFPVSAGGARMIVKMAYKL
jgi:uncharacterized protein (DUF2141 family)